MVYVLSNPNGLDDSLELVQRIAVKRKNQGSGMIAAPQNERKQLESNGKIIRRSLGEQPYSV